MNDESRDAEFERRYEARLAALAEDRVRLEGFETVACEPNADAGTCHYRLQQKTRGRWKHRPCGEDPLVVIKFHGPSQPSGMDVLLCRRCVGRLIRSLLGCLDY